MNPPLIPSSSSGPVKLSRSSRELPDFSNFQAVRAIKMNLALSVFSPFVELYDAGHGALPPWKFTHKYIVHHMFVQGMDLCRGAISQTRRRKEGVLGGGELGLVLPPIPNAVLLD